MFKRYVYNSRFKLPFSRLESFEDHIEWPLPSENRALRHLRDATPRGFWNHGVLGEALEQLRPSGSRLPGSPLSRNPEKIILPSSIGECRDLYIALTFYEGLDRPASLLTLLDQAMELLQPTQLYVGVEFVPQNQSHMGKLGIDELFQKLQARGPYKIFDVLQLLGRTFGQQDHFLHLHNKVFYYYSPFEVLAKMNGASVLFSHPEKTLDLSSDDLRLLSFLEREELKIPELELLLEYAESLNFGVKA